MDEATVAIYERRAAEWSKRRGDAGDDFGRRFRAQAGVGLVADLGCGSGRYLAQIGPPVVGVDATERMLALARARGYPLARADLERLPFGDGALAGVFGRHSYLHVPRQRLARALAEASRVLRPGGLLMITLIEGTYQGRALPGDDLPGRYFACWTEPDLTAVLDAAGFTDVHIEQAERRHGSPELLATARGGAGASARLGG
jgi:SAM-dependent methyltransferase